MRRHSTGRGSRLRGARTKGQQASKASYKMELPPTLYGEDVLNGNTELMTQSMDPAMLSAKLDNGPHSEALSLPGNDLMSQSVGPVLLRENLNLRERETGHSRPRTLFHSNRGSTDSGIKSDCDQMELQDVSDTESAPGMLQAVTNRLQSRLNPVPESLNSPDIAPGEV